MTELKPVAYAASVAVFLVIVAYAAAVQWSPVFRAKTVEAGWLTGMAGLRIVGFLGGVGAWLTSQAMWIPHLLVLLWSKRAAHATDATRRELAKWCQRRAFHRPQHAR